MPPASRAKIYRGTTRNLRFLAGKLRQGELMGVPSETVYGLAGDALNPRACRRIFAVKGRPRTDPLIVHIHQLEQLELIARPNPAAYALAKACWPGPLTLILPKQDCVPAEVTAGGDSVAVRMPAHPLFLRLLQAVGRPLAAPSANPFGYVSPTTAEHVRDGLGHRIDYILDGGPAKVGLESTIVDLRDPARPRLLRPGAISRADLRRILGRPVAAGPRRAASKQQVLLAPGLLRRHYSPRTRVRLHEQLTLAQAASSKPDHAWVFVKKPEGRLPANVFWLDAKGDLRGAARHLFSRLRQLDRGGYALIHLEQVAGAGLAEAINDRLRRAAAR
ncbi:MAG TPA: L-threonylcarbamoyladenylate synthase [Opitutaceae bacterium]|nr:L-threonylcarbamoyladenylate synthase [Opitutaceae bacterium]